MSNLALKKPKVEERNEDIKTETETSDSIPNPVDWRDLNPEDSLVQNRKFVLNELLRMILNKLSSQDLVQSARLVSKGWRDEAPWILKNNRLESFGVTFKFYQGKNIFILDQNAGKNQNDNPNQQVGDAQLQVENETSEDGKRDEIENSVSKLTSLLKSASTQQNSYFPTGHFKFVGASIDCPEVLKFFKVYGENIRKLTVDVRYNPLTLALTRGGTLWRKIFQLTPQLESLELMDSKRYDLWPDIDFDGNSYVGIPEIMNQGQDHGQGQILQQLRYLKFSDSIRNVKRIHTLLKHIEPVLPSSSAPSRICTIFIPSIRIFHYSYAERHSGPDLNVDLFKVNWPHIIPNELCLSDPALDSDGVGRLEKLAECRFRFKTICLTWHMELNSPQPQLSPNELARTGVAVWKIMEGARKTVEDVDFSILFFLLLSNQPAFPRFFPRLKSLRLIFIYEYKIQNQQDPDENQNQMNSISNRLVSFSELNIGRALVLWKNLSELMPSLYHLNITLFDGDCEPWLPFFDQDAGQNLTVKILNILNLHRREILGKISGPFPALTYLVIGVWIFPPPSSLDSVTNLIRWLFLFPLVKKKDTEHEQTLHPLLACKSLGTIGLEFQLCKGHLDLDPKQCPSSSSIPSLCSFSNVQGEKRLLFHNYDQWEEISAPAADLIHPGSSDSGSDSNSSSSPSVLFPKLFVITITCNQHTAE